MTDLSATISSSEADFASIMDELFDNSSFDLEQAGLAPMSLNNQPAPTILASYPEADLSESALPVDPSGDNTLEAVSSLAPSSTRGSEPVMWVKTLLNKLRDNRWSVARIVLYWLRLQGRGRGLWERKKADELANILLEEDNFFSSVTNHPKVRRWAMESYAPKIVADELDHLLANSKIFGRFDPDTSIADIGLLLDATNVVERDAPQLSSLV